MALVLPVDREKALQKNVVCTMFIICINVCLFSSMAHYLFQIE